MSLEVRKKNYDKILSDKGIVLDENLCVINFRGGEYRSIPNVLLRREYWRDSINHMLIINPNMKFVIITDDPNTANKFMPFPIESIHVDVGFDFYTLCCVGAKVGGAIDGGGLAVAGALVGGDVVGFVVLLLSFVGTLVGSAVVTLLGVG